MSKANFSLDKKVALTIGGTSGIGREISLAFAAAGAVVLPASRSADKVDRVVAELNVVTPGCRGYVLDACRTSELRATVEAVVAEYGRIDILLNSQGTTILKPGEEFTEDEYDRILDTNLKSVFFACAEVGRRMLEQESGAIINIASLAAYRGWRQSSLYSMSKWGVVGLTESLAAEWAPRGVRVNGIAPGFFLTALNRSRMAPARVEAAIQRTPMGRFGELPELVGAAVFLASEASAFVTGETIRVDGGYLAMGI